MKPFYSFITTAVVMAFLPAALHAQVITGLSAKGTPYSSYIVPTSGISYETSSDPYWAQFGVSGTDAGTDSSYVNVMSGASSAVTVSKITESVDTISATTQNSSGIDFMYDNGTSPELSTATIPSTELYGGSGTAGDISVATGILSGSNAAVLTFTLTFNQAVSKGTLDLVANDYIATSTYDFTFSNGAMRSVSNPTPLLTGPDYYFNDNDVYTLSFTNVPVGSVLTVTDTMSTVYGGNTSISGLAFTVLDVPEPSTWAMLLAGLAFLGFRMRGRSIFRA